MKYILVIIILISFFNFVCSDGGCPFCLQEGDVCKNNNSYACEKGTYCSNTTGYCAASVSEFGKCTSDLECKETLGCINSTCLQTKYLSLTELCQYDHQCISSTSCLPYSCGEFCNLACNFANPMAICNSTNQCLPNMVCVDNKCKTAKGYGKACSITAECQPYSTCYNSTCQLAYAMDIGQSCSHQYACDISKGLTCSRNGTCVKDTNPGCGTMLDPILKKDLFRQLEVCRIDSQCQVVEHNTKDSCIYKSCHEIIDQMNDISQVCEIRSSNSNSQSISFIQFLFIQTLILMISLILI